MEKILVSACLCGLATRYDGSNGNFPFLEKLRKFYEIVPFCPEVEGGLPIPRPRAEIVKGQVMTEDGNNITKNYNLGAEKALNLCHFLGIRIAILCDRSPSCGSRVIHDGSFKNNVIEGLGVTARVLIADGIKVYSDKDALEFLLPDEEEKKNKKSFSKGDKPRRSFKKDDKGDRPARKRTFKKDDEKPFGRKPFKKDWSKDNEGSFEKKPFKKRSYEKRDDFKKDERKPFKRRDDKKPYGEKKSFGDKRTYGEKKPFGRKPSGERKSFGEKKSFGRKPMNKGKSFGRKPAGRKPFSKPRDK